MPLSSSEPRAYERRTRPPTVVPLVETDNVGAPVPDIFEGAAVGAEEFTGRARPLQAGDRFLGFALEDASYWVRSPSDRRPSGAGVRIMTAGAVQLRIENIDDTHLGAEVWARDDSTFGRNGGGSFVGHVERVVAPGVAVVSFDAQLSNDRRLLA